ncbi:MAG: glycosyltransferase family 39 protein [Candidatus Saccharimonadales bacterium]
MNMFKKLVEKIMPKKESWIEKHHALVIALGVVLFMAIALWIGLRQSVWFDEAYSITIAKLPLGDLLHMTGLDTHPPLYYMLLKGWATVFGWNEFALRSLSVVAAGGAVAIGILLVRRLFGIRAALITLPFAVISPFLLRYAFEIRMYALASLICIAATYVLVVALEAKERRQKWLLYGGYAALVSLGVYTLYYTVLIWISHVVWLTWLARRNKQSVLKSSGLAAYVGSVILFLPWLPTFVSQITNGALAPISQPLTVDNLIGIVSFQFLYQPAWQLTALWSLVFVVLTVALIVLTVRAIKYIKKSDVQSIMLLLMYFMVPIIILTLVSLVRAMYVERYLAHVVLGLILLVGVIVSFAIKDNVRTTKLLASAVLVIMLAGVTQLIQVGNYNFQRLQQPQVKQAVSTISCKDGQIVLAADPYTAIEISYYLPSSCDLRFYSETASLSGGYAPLSNSPKRVENPSTELKGETNVIYVYYEGVQLNFENKVQTTSNFGPLHVSNINVE